MNQWSVLCAAALVLLVTVGADGDLPQQQQQDQGPVEHETHAAGAHGDDVQARQGSGGNRPAIGNGQLLSNLLQPLSPSNFLNNILPGRAGERRQIGEQCQFSSECNEGTPNSVCFNGTCLCNLGYRYTADTKKCTAVDTCPSCPTDKCSSGTDVYCNGTCITTLKSISVKGVGESGSMFSSPNWPKNYPSGTDMYYCITASAGRRVNIQFNWMDLETNCGYNCDYVRVYNGCFGHTSELVAFFHGDNVRSRECVTSSCNQMLVHFHSDSDDQKANSQRSGFMGRIREATYTNDLCNKCNQQE